MNDESDAAAHTVQLPQITRCGGQCIGDRWRVR